MTPTAEYSVKGSHTFGCSRDEMTLHVFWLPTNNNENSLSTHFIIFFFFFCSVVAAQQKETVRFRCQLQLAGTWLHQGAIRQMFVVMVMHAAPVSFIENHNLQQNAAITTYAIGSVNFHDASTNNLCLVSGRVLNTLFFIKPRSRARKRKLPSPVSGRVSARESETKSTATFH